MITAKVRSIFSVDIEIPLSHYVPPDPDHFELLVRIMVGPHPGEGEESFDITVCTPSWLGQECQRAGWVSGLYRLIVSSYRWEIIESAIKKLVERNSGKSWGEVALKVAQIGQWEFMDYRETQASS